MKTIFDNRHGHVRYNKDGHLLHRDKRANAWRRSKETWPDESRAKQALVAGQVTWIKLDDADDPDAERS